MIYICVERSVFSCGWKVKVNNRQLSCMRLGRETLERFFYFFIPFLRVLLLILIVLRLAVPSYLHSLGSNRLPWLRRYTLREKNKGRRFLLARPSSIQFDWIRRGMCVLCRVSSSGSYSGSRACADRRVFYEKYLFEMSRERVSLRIVQLCRAL